MQIVRDITTTVAPSATVVTLAEAKNYLRVDYSEDDTLITSLINTAQTRLEQYAGVAMTPRTLRVADVDFLTIGQYLQPSTKHYPIKNFITPEEFEN